ncbi:MAG: Short-chain-enoyl-CoA hydratase [Phycisphaerae bacterium]|nr:Short-chain-enoyl-CoA hydratase [Phycisphaerae bacterium]
MATTVETTIDGAVAHLRFAGEGKANVLSLKTFDLLAAAMDDLCRRPEVRVWILTGAGKTFLAGADIKELAALDCRGARDLGRRGNEVLSRLADAPAATIAAINGAALGGGCELALACDLRVMVEGAKIGLPETGLGVIPGWGGTQRLARLIGAGRAKAMILTADLLEADRAVAIGLVNQAAKPEELDAVTRALADRIVGLGPKAVVAAKQAITRGLAGDLEGGLRIETELFGQCFEPDGGQAREGLTAFLEKRKPNWS